MFLCQELGHLRDEGIDALVEGLPGAKGFEALIGGSADVFYNTPGGVLTSAAQGKRLKIFFVGQRTASAMLVVPPGKTARVRSVKELKGATVGVVSLGAPQHAALNGVPTETWRGPRRSPGGGAWQRSAGSSRPGAWR